MATPNINVILQAIAVVTNQLVANAPQIVSFDFANPTMPSGSSGGTAAYYEPYFQAATGGSVVNLPAAKVFGVFVQQLGTGVLNVSYTPFGGVSTTIGLATNGVFIYFDPSEAGQGISALTLTGVASVQSAAVMVCT
jgi:hypothetical protein